MNAHHDAHRHEPNRLPTVPSVESVLVAAVLGAFLVAVAGAGQLAVAAHVLALVCVWFLAVALLVGVAFGVVHVVATVEV
ncbi:hypothetical protein [Halogranum rubrum]|uniref:Uncharacterized protein n=1 Tax=Halogranum salarium B-1 TaxID=1210908 RepID=J2ZZP9_9EURY|nr:hypothetical protein [Halogranum salarium]EJN58523.1 hypothetical protein HSB1_30010 [Halogranum salarium B-1]